MILEKDLLFIQNEDEFALVKDNIKVEWVRLGEGLCGDYNPDDPDDIELLRFDVSVKDEDGRWQAVEDASYCTRVPANATVEQKVKLLKIILDKYYNELHDNIYASVKKLGEWLSWISLDDLKE